MRRYPYGWAAWALIGGVAWGVLQGAGSAGAATGPTPATGPAARAAAGFDRSAFQEELSRSPAELQALSDQALRAYVERLGALQSSLELGGNVSPSERRALNEHLLARAAQVGVILRERSGAPLAPGRGRDAAGASPGSTSMGVLAGMLQENSGIVVILLGGVIIAFALGSLVGYHRGSRHASYYGYAESDPRLRFLPRSTGRPAPPGGRPRITLSLIRATLLEGRTVLLQLGYEIAPAHRVRYLELMRQMRDALNGVEGQTYSVWEDPRHPNRFYELLACHRPTVLERLAAIEGPLPRLAKEIEACRPPNGPILRRVWWGIPETSDVLASGPVDPGRPEGRARGRLT